MKTLKHALTFARMQAAGKSSVVLRTDSDFLTWLSSLEASSMAIILDENTRQHCLPKLPKALQEAPQLLVAEGEGNKTLAECERLWTEMIGLGLDRKSMIFALGGGLICDLAGFVASTYKRGIAFTLIPTTLLAMVDAAIGGKTGVNFQNTKNQLGTFALPEALYLNYKFLESLGKRELLSGHAEVLKYALIQDAELFAILETKDVASLYDNNQIIQRCQVLKWKVVDEDPFEKGLRKTLNFGHTIGHALEAWSSGSQKPLLHGEAVAWGMVAEAYLAQEVLGFDAAKRVERYVEYIYPEHKPRLTEQDTDRIFSLMQADKKNESGKIGFALPDKVGSCQVNLFPSKESIEQALMLFH